MDDPRIEEVSAESYRSEQYENCPHEDIQWKPTKGEFVCCFCGEPVEADELLEAEPEQDVKYERASTDREVADAVHLDEVLRAARSSWKNGNFLLMSLREQGLFQ